MGLPGWRDDGEGEAPALKQAKVHQLEAMHEPEGEAQVPGKLEERAICQQRVQEIPEEHRDKTATTPPSDDEKEGKGMTPQQLKVMQTLIGVQQRAISMAGKAGKGSQASKAGVADKGAGQGAGKGSMSAPQPEAKVATANKIGFVHPPAKAPIEWPPEVLAHEEVPCFYCSAPATRKLMRRSKSSPRYIGACWKCMEWAINKNLFDEMGPEHYSETWDQKLLQQREQIDAT